MGVFLILPTLEIAIMQHLAQWVTYEARDLNAGIIYGLFWWLGNRIPRREGQAGRVNISLQVSSVMHERFLKCQSQVCSGMSMQWPSYTVSSTAFDSHIFGCDEIWNQSIVVVLSVAGMSQVTVKYRFCSRLMTDPMTIVVKTCIHPLPREGGLFFCVTLDA